MSTIPYKKTTALDKKYKPLVLKWLCSLFKYEDYPHSHADQWILWSIWDGQLSISFDTRQNEHNELISKIHPRFLGCPQYKTLKVVNQSSFYLELDHLLDLKYPEIIDTKLVHKTKHKDNDGDVFFTYDWEVYLDDGTSIMYHNQKPKMDMVKNDYIYNTTIQERAFTEFLDNNYGRN